MFNGCYWALFPLVTLFPQRSPSGMSTVKRKTSGTFLKSLFRGETGAGIGEDGV